MKNADRRLANDKLARELARNFGIIQEAVTNRYAKAEEWFIERYLVREGESVADARDRLKREKARRPPHSQVKSQARRPPHRQT